MFESRDFAYCLDCGAEIPPSAPEGLCRRCLLQVALKSDRVCRVRCPQCDHPLEILDAAPLVDMTCPF